MIGGRSKNFFFPIIVIAVYIDEKNSFLKSRGK